MLEITDEGIKRKEEFNINYETLLEENMFGCEEELNIIVILGSLCKLPELVEKLFYLKKKQKSIFMVYIFI